MKILHCCSLTFHSTLLKRMVWTTWSMLKMKSVTKKSGIHYHGNCHRIAKQPLSSTSSTTKMSVPSKTIKSSCSDQKEDPKMRKMCCIVDDEIHKDVKKKPMKSMIQPSEKVMVARLNRLNNSIGDDGAINADDENVKAEQSTTNLCDKFDPSQMTPDLVVLTNSVKSGMQTDRY